MPDLKQASRPLTFVFSDMLSFFLLSSLSMSASHSSHNTELKDTVPFVGLVSDETVLGWGLQFAYGFSPNGSCARSAEWQCERQWNL